MPLHADAVAQDRSAGKGARRIDRDHAHALAARAIMGNERIDHRGLAGAGIAGHAEHEGAPGRGIERAQDVVGAGTLIVELAHDLCAGAHVAVAHALGEREGAFAHAVARSMSSREMTRRCTSFVPSPISHNLQSRIARSTGNSRV